ncbi:MAG: hypothetical protein M1839_003573 [Geoglossum umbratile]|nr:MAG: hypothetical protein M1839_003573 [Geoglossum umbratile]
MNPSRLISALLLWEVGVSVAQNVFSGVWKPGTDSQVMYQSADWTNFTKKWTELENSGLLMQDYEVYINESNPVYFGLFQAGTGGHAAWIVTDWTDFTTKWGEFENQGLRMHDFEAYAANGAFWFAGIFHEGTGGHAAWVTSDWNDFTQKWGTWENQGLRMHDFESFVENGVRKYAGIFHEGTGGHAAWFTQDWNDFLKKWDEWDTQGLRLFDFEFWQDGSTWTFGGIFRPGTGGHYGWFRVDWENFRSFDHDRKKGGYILQDVEIFSTTCPNMCLNNLILPNGTYNYQITGTSTHCQGPPGTCAGNMQAVAYSAPFTEDGGERFVRLSAVLDLKQIFTLPFTDTDLWHNGWLYGPGSWHHAVDYSKSGPSFEVKAAAPGTVVHVGWDWWSGNTVVISHDDGADKDRYRTIYMHLRNGAKTDCGQTWSTTVPILKNDPSADSQAAYRNFTIYLAATLCSADGSTTPKADFWGAESDTIKVKPGDVVSRGQLLAQAGASGPGGCGCAQGRRDSPNTHLHIFFARRDPTDSNWYFFDPYGVYGPPDCYPGNGNGDPECSRYPIAWQGGTPKFPTG